MSTRGLIGFRVDEKDYLTYNHSDSYPTYLGKRLVEQYLSQIFPKGEKLKEKVRAIRLVDTDTVPTNKDIAKYKEYYDGRVGGPSEHITWYQLLRGAQGDLQACLGAGVMLDDHEFINDSLFCEWAYIFNLDDERFEVYKGFNHKDRYGRYTEGATPNEGGYLPCYLLHGVPFVALHTLDSVYFEGLEKIDDD